MQKDLSCGYIFGEVKVSQDRTTIDAELMWTDAVAISLIQSGKSELSVGYSTDLQPEQGIYNGVSYEFIQTNIKSNHCAIVYKGRAGISCSIADNDNVTNDNVVRTTSSTPRKRNK